MKTPLFSVVVPCSVLVSLAAVHISDAGLIVISITLGSVLFIIVAISDMDFEMEEKLPDVAYK